MRDLSKAAYNEQGNSWSMVLWTAMVGDFWRWGSVLRLEVGCGWRGRGEIEIDR